MGWGGMGQDGRGLAGRRGGGVLLWSPGPAAPTPTAGDREGNRDVPFLHINPNSTLRYSYMPS